jgi:IS5 family transposase
VLLYRELAQLENWANRLPDATTILRFRHLLERHQLTSQILVLINDLLRERGMILKTGTRNRGGGNADPCAELDEEHNGHP